MPNEPHSNVKIYNRPERKAPSPLLLAIGLIVSLLIAYFVYRTYFRPATQPEVGSPQSSAPSSPAREEAPR